MIFFLIKFIFRLTNFFSTGKRVFYLSFMRFKLPSITIFFSKRNKIKMHNWFDNEGDSSHYPKNEKRSYDDILVNSITILFYLFLFYFFAIIYITPYLHSLVSLVLPDYLLELARLFSQHNYIEEFLSEKLDISELLRGQNRNIFLKLNFFLHLFWK